MTPAATPTAADWIERASAIRPRRDKSLHALDGYTQLKTTWFDLSGG
jgi:hypothetical protein